MGSVRHKAHVVNKEQMAKPTNIAALLAAGQNPSESVVINDTEEQDLPAPPVPTVVPQATSLDQNAVTLLLQYLIAKEGRELAESQKQDERRKAIQKQRDRNAKDQDTKILLKQARCKHLKGGKKGPKTQNKDYAVYQHRFIDSTVYIRCRICGMRWYSTDTRDYLMRNGHKISNHTHIGWYEAVAMTDASTDTSSASEWLTNVNPQSAGSYRDAAGLEIQPRITDMDTGQPAEGVIL